MDQVSIIGIDLAKHSFQLHGALDDGSVAFRKKLSRGKVLDFLASQPPFRNGAFAVKRVFFISDRRDPNFGSRTKVLIGIVV